MNDCECAMTLQALRQAREDLAVVERDYGLMRERASTAEQELSAMRDTAAKASSASEVMSGELKELERTWANRCFELQSTKAEAIRASDQIKQEIVELKLRTECEGKAQQGLLDALQRENAELKALAKDSAKVVADLQRQSSEAMAHNGEEKQIRKAYEHLVIESELKDEKLMLLQSELSQADEQRCLLQNENQQLQAVLADHHEQHNHLKAKHKTASDLILKMKENEALHRQEHQLQQQSLQDDAAQCYSALEVEFTGLVYGRIA